MKPNQLKVEEIHVQSIADLESQLATVREALQGMVESYQVAVAPDESADEPLHRRLARGMVRAAFVGNIERARSALRDLS